MRSRWIHAPRTPLIAARQAALAGALVCSLLLGALSIALADQVPFMPPAGWAAAQPPRGMLGVWIHSGDKQFRQNIVVGRERTALSADGYGQHTVAMLSKGLPGFQLGADEMTTTCGGRRAHYLSYSGILNGHQVLYEHMSTTAGGYGWFAIYSRLMTQPSLPEARQSLTTLCGLQASSGHQTQQIAPTPPAQNPAPTAPPETPTPAPNPYATLAPMIDY